MEWCLGSSIEVHILQAIPPEIRQVAATKLASLVASNGNLVCIGRINLTGEELDGPPWPLERQFIEMVGSIEPNRILNPKPAK